MDVVQGINQQSTVPYTMDEVPALLRYFYRGKKSEQEIQKVIEAQGNNLLTNPKFVEILSGVKEQVSNLPKEDELDVSPEEVPSLLNVFYKGNKSPEEIKKIIEFHGESLLSDPAKLMMLIKVKKQQLDERSNITYEEPKPEGLPPTPVPVEEEPVVEPEPEPAQIPEPSPYPTPVVEPEPLPVEEPAPVQEPQMSAGAPISPQPLQGTNSISRTQPTPMFAGSPNPMQPVQGVESVSGFPEPPPPPPMAQQPMTQPPMTSPVAEPVQPSVTLPPVQPAPVDTPAPSIPRGQGLSEVPSISQIMERDISPTPVAPPQSEVLGGVPTRRSVIERNTSPMPRTVPEGELLGEEAILKQIQEKDGDTYPKAPPKAQTLGEALTNKVTEKDLRWKEQIHPTRPLKAPSQPSSYKPSSDTERVANYAAAVGVKGKDGKKIYGSKLANMLRSDYEGTLKAYPELKGIIDEADLKHKTDAYSLVRGLPVYTDLFGKSLKANPNINKVVKDYPNIAKLHKSLRGVDTSHIFDNEGGLYLTGYVPSYYSKRRDKDVVIGNSGVTVGAGIDLGSTSKEELESYGLSKEGVAKLEPYLGLKKDKAMEALKATPFELGFEDAMKVTLGKAKMLVNRASSVVSAKGGKKFDDFKPEIRTTMFDLVYQGLNKTNKNILNKLADEDYQGAIDALRNAEKAGASGTRARYAERRSYIEPLLIELAKTQPKKEKPKTIGDHLKTKK